MGCYGDRRTFLKFFGTATGTAILGTLSGCEQPKIPSTSESFKSDFNPHRFRLAGDPHRPGYHFLAPANWMDDPNGVIQFNGEFHLFYQWIPNSPSRSGGPFHWGHAVSNDLVNWRDLPIALSPTPGGPDQEGCWSGSSVNNQEIPTIIYHGRVKGKNTACLATSVDNLITWKKHPSNPVIVEASNTNELPVGDPYVWYENSWWYCVMGSHTKVGGAAILYRSKNLKQWEYLGPLLTGKKEKTAAAWEFVNFFSLGKKHFLTASLYNAWKSIYFSGTYKNHQFSSEFWTDLDSGGHFYAPYVFSDDQKRQIMMAWSWEGRHEDLFIAAGWSGVHILPRVLSSQPDGTLRFFPIPELQRLRGDHQHLQNKQIQLKDKKLLSKFKGDMVEILAVLEPGNSYSVGLRVLASPGCEEETLISFEQASKKITIDRRKASLDDRVHKHVYRTQPVPMKHHGSVRLEEGESLTLHVFVDRSIVEVFVNNRLCMTSRIYPTQKDSTGVGLFVTGGSAKLRSLDVWQINPIWPT